MEAIRQESATEKKFLSNVGRFFDFPATERKQRVNDCRFCLIVATRKNPIDDEGGNSGRIALS